MKIREKKHAKQMYDPIYADIPLSLPISQNSPAIPLAHVGRLAVGKKGREINEDEEKRKHVEREPREKMEPNLCTTCLSARVGEKGQTRNLNETFLPYFSSLLHSTLLVFASTLSTHEAHKHRK